MRGQPQQLGLTALHTSHGCAAAVSFTVIQHSGGEQGCAAFLRDLAHLDTLDRLWLHAGHCLLVQQALATVSCTFCCWTGLDTASGRSDSLAQLPQAEYVHLHLSPSGR